MTPPNFTIEQRITQLERSLRRIKLLAFVALLALLVAIGAAFRTVQVQVSDEVRTHRLAVVDGKGHIRAVLGEDEANVGRVSRASGLTLYDTTGAERGGFSTMTDGSVTLGLDAPVWVGAPMRDRIGLKVFSNGAAYAMLIDNKTRAVARLISEEGSDGARGVQVFQVGGRRFALLHPDHQCGR